MAAYDENNNKDKKFQSTRNLGMGARIIGGMGNLRGSILATIVLYALPELLRGFSTYRMLIYAIVMIAMMLFNWAPAAKDFRSRIVEKIKGHVKEKEAA